MQVADDIGVGRVERPVLCLVNVCDAGEVVDELAVRRRAGDGLAVHDVADHHLLAFSPVRRIDTVEDAHPVTGVGECIRNMAAEETAAAKYHNPAA